LTRLLRAIRFDVSDTHVFPRAAEPDEWAIPGGFVFGGSDPRGLSGKERQAFVSGFLALGSFGFTTLVSVAEARTADLDVATNLLADHLETAYGAPTRLAALEAAKGELGFATELADGVPLNTLLALKREIDEVGEVRESFHIVTPPGEKPHARVWDVVEDD